MTLKPDRCFSCGKSLNAQYGLYERLTEEDGFSDTDALSQLGLNRTCCTRMILTGVSVEHFEGEQLEYEAPIGGTVASAESAAVQRRAAEVSRGPQRARAIPHLEGYVPPGAPFDFTPDTMFLADDAPLRRDEPDDLPLPVEWPERSRVLALISLLTRTIATDERRVLYLGCGGLSADGVKFVLDLFPRHEFNLVDWRGVSGALKKLAKDPEYEDRLTVSARKFGDADATNVKGDVDVLFCEYGLADVAQPQYEHAVDRDMQAQLRWAVEIEPARSLLRLSVPRISGPFEYAQGRLQLAPWTSPRNTSAYLHVENSDELAYVNYDYRAHVQRMLHHDRVTRLAAWQHKEIDAKYAIDACWDCAAECSILEAYVRATNPNRIGTKVVADVRELTQALSVALDASESLSLQTPPRPEETDEDSEEVLESLE
jgi:DNA-directed RNA polymerase subunit N (RpoN/RPB10)